MRIANIDEHSCNAQKIAIIGMPRSGSTIVASYINSINGAMIIGEPFLQAKRSRPEGHEWPTLVNTRWGTLEIPYRASVFDTVEEFGKKYCVQTIGFKECMTAAVDVVSLVEDLLPRLDLVIVVIREPRKNFMSMLQLTPDGHVPLSVDEFNEWYIRLIDLTLLRTSRIQPLHLDWFRIDPKQEIADTAGWNLVGSHIFKSYSGGGDNEARVSGEVHRVDQRVPYAIDDILPAVDAYENSYVSSLFERIIHSERIIP